jgi:hypothetical protein
MPFPLAREARIASSTFCVMRGRPIGFPCFVPFSRALARPAKMRSCGQDALLNDRALELGEHAKHLK